MREQKTHENTQVKTASGITFLAGLWLMLSSYFMGLGFTSNEFIVGIIVAAISLIGMYSVEQATWVSWVNGIMGVWLLITPIFMAGLTTTLIWNSVVLGVIVLGAAIWSGMASSSTMGHGHPRGV